MKAIIEIDMDGAAFTEWEDRCFELQRLLDHLAEDIRNGCRVQTIRDCNGNTCGRFEIVD